MNPAKEGEGKLSLPTTLGVVVVGEGAARLQTRCGLFR